MDIAELYEVYYEPCCRFARALCGCREEAEDICQEAFIRAMSYLPLLNILPEEKRRIWLYTVIRNMRIDAWRRKQRREMMMKNYFDVTGDEEAQMEHEILRWDVKSLVADLPRKDRNLIVKRYWLRMNSTEIGDEMGVSPSTVRYRLRKALKLLKRTYKRREE